MKPRHVLLALALAAAAVLALLPAEPPEDDIVAPVRRVADSRAAAAKAGTPTPAVPPSEERQVGKPAFAPKTESDPFAALSFRPPPPPPPKIVPPPPMAPPLPFGFVGIWTENGEENVFLSQRDAVLTVKKGQTLLGTWRLDDVQPGTLVFTFVPLNQQKTLRTAP